MTGCLKRETGDMPMSQDLWTDLDAILNRHRAMMEHQDPLASSRFQHRRLVAARDESIHFLSAGTQPQYAKNVHACSGPGEVRLTDEIPLTNSYESRTMAPRNVARRLAAAGREVALGGGSMRTRILVAAAYRTGFGAPPVLLRSGGTIPMASMFQESLGVPTVLMGFALPNDSLHGPNEKFSLPVFRKAIHTSIAFLHKMARREWPSPASAQALRRTWPLSRFKLPP